MKTTNTGESRHHRLREAYRRELGSLGLFIEGSLCKIRRPGRKPPAWQLTFKQAGKTRTVYVPKRLKRLVRKITAQNLAIIRRHTAARRAESRARPPSAKSSGGTCASSSSTASRS
jgi:hypothetical protein